MMAFGGLLLYSYFSLSWNILKQNVTTKESGQKAEKYPHPEQLHK